MATHQPMRREWCSHGSSCVARWSVTSLMILWLPWVLLWLPWPAQGEQIGGGGHTGKAFHGSLSSPSSSSSSTSSSLPYSSSLFTTRQSEGQLDWLLSEKGPFHKCPEYTEFRERFQLGFSTRYKIYRWDRSMSVCVCVSKRRLRGTVCRRKLLAGKCCPPKHQAIWLHAVVLSSPCDLQGSLCDFLL